MLMKDTFVWGVVAAVSLAAPFGAMAQQEKSEDVTRWTIALTNLKAGDVESLIRERLPEAEDCTILTSENPDMLQVIGVPKKVQLVQQFVEQLTPPRPKQHTELIDVQTYPVKELFKIVGKTLWKLDAAVAMDPVHRRLIVTGSQEEINAVRYLVERLDRPKRSLEMEFFVMRGVSHGKGRELPNALAPIVRTLSEKGFGDAWVPFPLLVHVNDGSYFQKVSVVRTTLENGTSEELNIDIDGKGEMSASGDSVELELSTSLYSVVRNESLQGEDKKPSRSAPPGYRVETKLTIPPNKFVILTGSPFSAGDTESVAIIVRVKLAD